MFIARLNAFPLGICIYTMWPWEIAVGQFLKSSWVSLSQKLGVVDPGRTHLLPGILTESGRSRAQTHSQSPPLIVHNVCKRSFPLWNPIPEYAHRWNKLLRDVLLPLSLPQPLTVLLLQTMSLALRRLVVGALSFPSPTYHYCNCRYLNIFVAITNH